MAYVPLIKVVPQFFDSLGDPLVGGTLNAYVAGSTTPTNMFSDNAGTVAGTSVTLDSRGEPTTIKLIWISTAVTYKFILKDSSGTTIWTIDNIVPSDLIDGSVTAAKLANDSVTTSKIANNAVTTVKILDANVTTAKIADLNVTTGKLAANAVTTAKITDANVTAAKLATDAVETDKIKDLNVTTGKLADSAVTTIKITDANVTPAKLSQPFVKETAKVSTSGTTVEFTGIPSWVNKITVMFNGISGTGTSYCIVQGGTSGGYETSSYVCNGSNLGAGSGASATTIAFTNGFPISASSLGAASETLVGTLTHAGSNVWLWSCTGTLDATAAITWGVGKKTLSGTLDRIRIALSTSATSMAGTDTFDAGSFNISYQ